MVSFVNLSGEQSNRNFNLWQKNQMKVEDFSNTSVEYAVIRTAVAGIMAANFLSNSYVLDVRLCTDHKYKDILDQCLADAYKEAFHAVLSGGRPLDTDLLYCRDQVMLSLKHREVSIADIRPLIENMSVHSGFTEHLCITFSRYCAESQLCDNVAMGVFKLRSLLLLITWCLDINTVFISVKGERIGASHNPRDLLKVYPRHEVCAFEAEGSDDSYLTRKSMKLLNKLIKANHVLDFGDFFIGLGDTLLSTSDPDRYVLPDDPDDVVLVDDVDSEEDDVSYPMLNTYMGDRFAYAEKLWLFLERCELKNKAAYLSGFVDIVLQNQNDDTDSVMPAIDNAVYNNLLFKCYRYLTIALRHTLATVI